MIMLRFGCVLLALFFVAVLSGCLSYQVDSPDAYKIKGVQYGVTRGNFFGRWWNFYERGRSFAEGGFWREAEVDLYRAVSMRTKDFRQSRTYGMHFIPYFGNRELGVVLYHQGRIEEAMHHLKSSIEHDPTEKAEHYLNLCQQDLSAQSKDNEIPSLYLDPPPRLINSTTIALSGKAMDNGFIDRVTLNGASISPLLKPKELPFSHEINLIPGASNSIDVTAVDTAGNVTQQKFIVIVDIDGPVIEIFELSPQRIVLTVTDEYEIILQKELLTGVELERREGEDFTFRPVRSDTIYSIKFTDTAGNINGIKIHPEELTFGKFIPRGWGPDKQTRLLSLKGTLSKDHYIPDVTPTNSIVLGNSVLPYGPSQAYQRTRTYWYPPSNRPCSFPYLVASTEVTPGILPHPTRKNVPINPSLQPSLHVELPFSKIRVFQEYIILSGRLHGEFTNFKINGKSKIKKGKDVRFSFKEFLKLDKPNEFTLEFSDKTGRVLQALTKKYVIHRLPDPHENRNLRATAVLCPPAKEQSNEAVDDLHFTHLFHELDQSGRFQLLVNKKEELDRIGEEYQLIKDGWIRTHSAAKIGNFYDVDYTIACVLRPTQNDVEIFGRLIDSRTRTVLAVCDVYEYSTKTMDFQDAYKRFVNKLVQNFPIVEIPVTPSNFQRETSNLFTRIFFPSNEMQLEMGTDTYISKGMKFLAYHYGPPLRSLETDEILVHGEIEIDGTLFARNVKRNSTALKPIDKTDITRSRYVVSQ